MPTSISVEPNPEDLDDAILLYLTSSLTKSLAKHHGLEHAMKLVHDAAMGKIDETKFTMKWSTPPEYEGFEPGDPF